MLRRPGSANHANTNRKEDVMHPIYAKDIDESYLGQKVQGGFTLVAICPDRTIVLDDLEGCRQVWGPLEASDEVWFDLSYECPSCGFDSDDLPELAAHMGEKHLRYPGFEQRLLAAWTIANEYLAHTQAA